MNNLKTLVLTIAMLALLAANAAAQPDTDCSVLSLKDENQLSDGGAQVCLLSSADFCTDAFSGIDSEKCGAEMGDVIKYYMLGRGETTNLDLTNTSCKMVGDALQCYGGITLEGFPEVDRIKVKEQNISGLVGAYAVYAEVKDYAAYPGVMPLRITVFTLAPSAKAVWGNIVQYNNTIKDLGPREKSTVPGKPVPVGFSVGEWQCDDSGNYGAVGCPFKVHTESVASAAIGREISISQVAEPAGVEFGGLTYYRDSLDAVNGLNGVDANESFEIDYTGLLVLWVVGDYRVAEDVTYSLNVADASGDPLLVNVSSSTTPIITRAPVISNNQEPKYYNLKGEPLGSKKPSKAGAYIVRQGGVSRIWFNH